MKCTAVYAPLAAIMTVYTPLRGKKENGIETADTQESARSFCEPYICIQHYFVILHFFVITYKFNITFCCFFLNCLSFHVYMLSFPVYMGPLSWLNR